MTLEKFEELLNQPESNILDFKREQYCFSNDSDNVNTTKFVKDIISFSNTIRTKTAYIILGVGFDENGRTDLIGIKEFFDDAIYQDKIKDKVSPIPYFAYSTIRYEEKTFGIIEIPVKKNAEPIFPTIKMRGLEVGKVYLRRGSSNSEATGREVILLSKWLESLPNETIRMTNNEFSEILLDVTSNSTPLSNSITLTLNAARKYSLSELLFFCEGELTGWYEKAHEINAEVELSYRMSDVIMTPSNIEINPYSYVQLNSNQLLNEIQKIDEYAKKMKMLFPQTVFEIEKYLKDFSHKKDNSLVVFTSDSDSLFRNPKLKNIKIRSYTTVHNFEAVYLGIKEKLISQLIEYSK